MDDLVVRPEALVRRAEGWEEAAGWLRDSEREVATVSLAAVGEGVRPAATRFWAVTAGRTQAGVQAADGLSQALRGVVADVSDADMRVAEVHAATGR